MKDFKNKNVYITGGSSGIGLATAKLFASKGANVIIFARNEERLEKAVQEISDMKQSGNEIIAYKSLDIKELRKITHVLDEILRTFGIPNILINCAGRAIPHYFENITPEQFEETIDINLKGMWYVTSKLVPHMKEKGGHIVNVSSVAGFVGVFGYTDYCASKFGVIGFSEALKSELKPHNIQVSVLCPPDTETPGFQVENQTKPKETKAISGNAKLLSPEQVAQALLKGITRKQFLIIPGTEGKLTYWIKRLAPSLLDWIMDREIKKVNKHS